MCDRNSLNRLRENLGPLRLGRKRRCKEKESAIIKVIHGKIKISFKTLENEFAKYLYNGAPKYQTLGSNSLDWVRKISCYHILRTKPQLSELEFVSIHNFGILKLHCTLKAIAWPSFDRQILRQLSQGARKSPEQNKTQSQMYCFV